MSHTRKTEPTYNHPGALEAAVKAIGGAWLGMGSHHLYQGNETGLGFTLPGWKFPLVAKQDGSLRLDDYNGHWGNAADLLKLKREFCFEKARIMAEEQGWYGQRETVEVEGKRQDAMVLYTGGDGRVLVLADGTVSGDGFTGTACSLPVKMMADAIGTTVDESYHSEYHLDDQQQELYLEGGQ